MVSAWILHSCWGICFYHFYVNGIPKLPRPGGIEGSHRSKILIIIFWPEKKLRIFHRLAKKCIHNVSFQFSLSCQKWVNFRLLNWKIPPSISTCSTWTHFPTLLLFFKRLIIAKKFHHKRLFATYISLLRKKNHFPHHLRLRTSLIFHLLTAYKMVP